MHDPVIFKYSLIMLYMFVQKALDRINNCQKFLLKFEYPQDIIVCLTPKYKYIKVENKIQKIIQLKMHQLLLLQSTLQCLHLHVSILSIVFKVTSISHTCMLFSCHFHTYVVYQSNSPWILYVSILYGKPFYKFYLYSTYWDVKLVLLLYNSFLHMWNSFLLC